LKAAIMPMILWGGDSGYDITAFDMAAGIEERSSMKFEKD